MLSRNLCLLSLVTGCGAVMFAAPTFGGDHVPGQWDRTMAAKYLEEREQAWFDFTPANRGQGATATTCVSCHSLIPYALSRPVLRRLSNEHLPTKLERKILEQARARVLNWDRLDSSAFQLLYDFDDAKKRQSRGTEAIVNALLLSLDDNAQGRQEPSDATKKALSILWATQIKVGQHKGSWEWLNFGLEPWESDSARYLGASLAAIAVGTTPADAHTKADRSAQERLESLRQYLKSGFPSQNLHNQVWMLWASSRLDLLLTAKQKERLIEQVLSKQQAGGGWSLCSLGDFAKKGVSPEVTKPDGYATGLVLHVLQVAGLPRDNRHVKRGLAWLQENQDPTGAWRALSVNKNRSPESTNAAKAHVGKFMWDAATAYAILALSHQ